MNKTLVNSGMALAVVLGAGMISQPAQAFTFTLQGTDNIGSKPIKVQGEIIDLGENLQFKIDIVPEATFSNIGDMRGIWFDIKPAFNNLIGTFSIVSPTQPISNFTQVLDGVGNLKGGVNVNPAGGFDLGFEVGDPGIGNKKFDIQSITFELASSTGPLGLELFNQSTRFAVRATSVGPAGSRINNDNDAGSAKIVGEVPTPALLPGLIGLGVAALRKKQENEVAEEV